MPLCIRWFVRCWLSLAALAIVTDRSPALADPAIVEGAGKVVEAAQAEPAKPAAPPTISAKSLHSAMQKAAVKYREDKNKLVNDQRFTAMRDELVKDFGSTSITYRVKIRRIDWKDGVVSLLTHSPMPDVKASNQNPLKFWGPSELELKMEEKEAAALQPGDWVTFTGTLTLQPGKWGAVGKSTHSQQQFTIHHHKLLPGHFIGTFTSVDYTGEIKGKVYPGKWQAEDAGK